jgi:type IV secretion system protein VirB5
MRCTWKWLTLSAFFGITVAPAVHAQWAVVDAPAIVQLIQEVETLEQQLQTAKDQLQQARQALQTMTGSRGMENLLSGTVRNYLPANWAGIGAALNGTGILGNQVQSTVNASAVLTQQQLAALSPGAQQLIQDARQWNALRSMVAQTAFANSSDRFASLQSLISSIGAAGDQKAILDLQARINGELGMLQNEQTKLQTLAHAVDAQDAILKLKTREQVVNGHGRFQSRFQPAP